jgi:hypothetical protein
MRCVFLSLMAISILGCSSNSSSSSGATNSTGASDSENKSDCLKNLKQLSAGILMYSTDYDGVFPPAATWMDAIVPYSKNSSVYRCPAVESENQFGYAYNSSLGGAKGDTQANSKTPMVYDSSNLARNANDPASSQPNPPRHGGNNVVKADGSG